MIAPYDAPLPFYSPSSAKYIPYLFIPVQLHFDVSGSILRTLTVFCCFTFYSPNSLFSFSGLEPQISVSWGSSSNSSVVDHSKLVSWKPSRPACWSPTSSLSQQFSLPSSASLHSFVFPLPLSLSPP